MKLYYFPGACSLASHIALEWAGGPYELVRMSLDSVRSEAYKRLNPSGAVPLLIDGDFKLTESVAILGYIADRFPSAGLLGDGDSKARAEVIRWLAYLNSDVHMAFKPIFTPSRFLADPLRRGELEGNARAVVARQLELIDRAMEGNDWIAGARSIADPYLFVVLRWAIRKGIPIEGLPNLVRFHGAMLRDERVLAAIAEEEGVAEAA